jgi:hypothetical protein
MQRKRTPLEIAENPDYVQREIKSSVKIQRSESPVADNRDMREIIRSIAQKVKSSKNDISIPEFIALIAEITDDDITKSTAYSFCDFKIIFDEIVSCLNIIRANYTLSDILELTAWVEVLPVQETTAPKQDYYPLEQEFFPPEKGLSESMHVG